MGHEAASQDAIIQLYSHLPHTAVEPIGITRPGPTAPPPRDELSSPRHHTIQTSSWVP
jgi:hypothetical protein